MPCFRREDPCMLAWGRQALHDSDTPSASFRRQTDTALRQRRAEAHLSCAARSFVPSPR